MEKLKKIPVPFAQVPNDLLTSKDVSATAKALWAYIQSKPDGWDFSAARIAQDFKEGRKTVLAAINNLIHTGWLERDKQSTGRVNYILHHTIARVPKADSGTVQNGHRAEWAPISKKDIKQERDKEINLVAPSATEESFYFARELANLKNGGKKGVRKDYKIIALYWNKKGWMFENAEQFNAALTRELKPAKALKGYSGEQIALAIQYCRKEYPDIWTLETVHKRITDLINRAPPP